MVRFGILIGMSSEKQDSNERDSKKQDRKENDGILTVSWLGRVEFQAAWELQQHLAEQRKAGDIGDTLLLLEHPPTLTLGRKAQQEHLLATPDRLDKEGIALVEVDRGGDITYHGPGQLVGYPILNLKEPPHRPDLHKYLRDLEEVLIRALAISGIEAGRFPGYTGVWVGLPDTSDVALSNSDLGQDTGNFRNVGSRRSLCSPAKIAAIGVKSSRWITQHGFALNVCPDLSHFRHIVPCGIREYGVTSLAHELGQPIETQALLAPIYTAFLEVFGYASLDIMA